MKKITLVAALFAAFAVNAQDTHFFDNFETDVIDAVTFNNWESVDVDGDGEFWEVADILDFAINNAPAHPMQSLAADSDSWEGTPFTPDNFLITSALVDLSTSGSTEITYVVGTYQTSGQFVGDKYSIYMSTSNDPADIINETPIYTATVGDDAPSDQGDGSASAATVTVDASAYDGQQVYLTFRHYDTFDENSVLIDDVEVTGQPLSVGDQSFNNFAHYVRNNELNLSAATAMESVSIFNVLGQEVVSQRLNSTNETVSLASLNTGVYIASVVIEGQRKSFKIVRK